MLSSECLLSLDGCALQVMEEIRRAGFEAPTPIQAQVSQTPSIDALSLHSISPSDTRPIHTTDTNSISYVSQTSGPCDSQDSLLTAEGTITVHTQSHVWCATSVCVCKMFRLGCSGDTQSMMPTRSSLFTSATALWCDSWIRVWHGDGFSSQSVFTQCSPSSLFDFHAVSIQFSCSFQSVSFGLYSASNQFSCRFN